MIVCDVPVIGSEPETVAEVLIPITERFAIVPSREELSAAILPATVNFFDVPAEIVTLSPTVV